VNDITSRFDSQGTPLKLISPATQRGLLLLPALARFTLLRTGSAPFAWVVRHANA
jgi:hypothetical protein